MKMESRAQFKERVIHDLKIRSSAGLLFYIVLAAIIITADGFYGRHPAFSLFFIIGISGLSILRLIHLVVCKFSKSPYSTLHNIVFYTSVGISGLFWGGCFARIMILDGELSAKFLMATCTAGLSAGGVVAFIPNFWLAILYSFAMTGPAIVSMSSYQTNLPLAVAFLLYGVYMAFIGNRGYREYWQALENEQLLIEKSEQLNMLSRLDGLTGLYNRRHFDERLDQEWEKSTRVQQPPTVIIFDIDFFKRINDQYGHQAGDEFLKLTASLLKTVFKRNTDIVARLGGEEFIVLLTDSTPQKAFELAEDMRRRMEEMLMPHNGANISTTVSIGVASVTPQSSESRNSLIARADKALYRAKREGRNQTQVASDLHSGP